MHRLEQAAVVILVAVTTVLPTAVHGWPVTVAGNVFVAALSCGCAGRPPTSWPSGTNAPG